jgi:hypothetical protein
LWGDLNTVGREAGSPLRLLENKTTLPQPLPLKEGALPTPAARGRSEESKQKVDLLEQCTGHGSGAF